MTRREVGAQCTSTPVAAIEDLRQLARGLYRVEALDGEFLVKSAAGAGTTVTAALPVRTPSSSAAPVGGA